MDYFCVKCLVNKVEYDGGICSVCGGDNTAKRNYDSEYDSSMDEKYVNSSRHSVTQNSSNYSQGNVNIASHRRIMGAQQPSSNGIVDNNAQYSNNNNVVNITVPNKKTASKPKKITSCSGVIQNFTTGPDERTFLNRIVDSLFLGISYNGKNNLFMTEFQLYENWNSGYGNSSSSNQATRVVYYGKVGQGRPVENNDVTVYGAYDTKNNYFIAESIMNQTDGTYANFIPRKIPAVLIRLGVIGILLAILYFVLLAAFGGNGSSATESSGSGVGIRQILFGLITIASGACLFFFSRSSRKGTRAGTTIAGITLVALGILIMTITSFEKKAAVFVNSVTTIAISIVMVRLTIGFLLSAFDLQDPKINKVLNSGTVIFSILYIIWAGINIFFM